MVLAIGNLKFCSGCQTTKPITEYYKHRRLADGLQNNCKDCKRVTHKNWKYALKSGQFEQMKKSQYDECAICRRKVQELLVDHCHKTGKLRGLLCRKCNSMLGMCNDNIDTLRSAINYIGQYSLMHSVTVIEE